MRFTEEYKIEGTPMLAPDEGVAITRTDLDSADSGRDEGGFMHRVLVRSRVMTWEFTYSHLTAGEYAYMQNLLADRPSFQFTYLDQGTPRTVTAYCSTDSITYRNARTGLYGNLKLKIIEC